MKFILQTTDFAHTFYFCAATEGFKVSTVKKDAEVYESLKEAREAQERLIKASGFKVDVARV